MMMRLSLDRRTWAAWCDRCLIGSYASTHADVTLARRFAALQLRSLGWTHVAPPGLKPDGQQIAESAWTGETYCFECSMRLRRDAAARVPGARTG
jgi:hypothetical protein